MSAKSNIEWTDATWNPTTGCSKVSEECDNCYTEGCALWCRRMGVKKYANGFSLALHPEGLDTPLKWRKPKKVFVDSMSDLFHVDVPFEFTDRVFDVIRRCPRHLFQILTKRSWIMVKYSRRIGDAWPENAWAGVSIGLSKYKYRFEHLRHVQCNVRFLSLEPLLGPLGELDLSGIHWVIVGGESGKKARPMHPDWAREVRDQCLASHVPFFFKQWGGKTHDAGGRLLDGRTWDEFPVQLEHREIPIIGLRNSTGGQKP